MRTYSGISMALTLRMHIEDRRRQKTARLIRLQTTDDRQTNPDPGILVPMYVVD